ncbi:MAG: hypothetical protein ACLGH3_01890 [Actinomycetota bacterium]
MTCWVESTASGLVPSEGSCGGISSIDRAETIAVGARERVVVDLAVSYIGFVRSGLIYEGSEGDGAVAATLSIGRSGCCEFAHDRRFLARESSPGPTPTEVRLIAGSCYANESLGAGEYRVSIEIHAGLKLSPGLLPDSGRAEARALLRVLDVRAQSC